MSNREDKILIRKTQKLEKALEFCNANPYEEDLPQTGDIDDVAAVLLHERTSVPIEEIYARKSTRG